VNLTEVGKCLSVGADPSPDGVGDFDLVVLVSAEHQHAGDRFTTNVIRCPLPDVDDPSTEVIQRAQRCAERVAYALCPFSVPFELWKKLTPGSGWSPMPLAKDPEPVEAQRVLVTCEEGLNRSLLVAGMALVLTGEQRTGKDAREYLQKLRGPEAFESPGYKRALERFYPDEYMRFRNPPLPAPPGGGMILR
jgi:hypothetical protein